jgi:hypothetical protein
LGEGFEENSQMPPLPCKPFVRSHNDSILAHKLLFAYVLDKCADFATVELAVLEQEIIADCICLAHYYDLDDVIAPNLAKDIQETPRFSEYVTAQPRFYLQLAAMLRDRELFEVSFRCYFRSHYQSLKEGLFVHNKYYAISGVARPTGFLNLPVVSEWDKAKADGLLAKYHGRMQELIPKLDCAVRQQFVRHGNLLGSTVLPDYTNEDDVLKAGLLAIGIASEWYNSEVVRTFSKITHFLSKSQPGPPYYDEPAEDSLSALA